jgi:predicted kinase
MKPKLIILNGPCGVGKTTLAEIYKNEHEMTLLLDIDDVRRFMGKYRKNKEESRTQMYRLALVMAREHLKNGYSVIIPNLLRDITLLESLEIIAKETGADFYECVLITSKEEAIRRATERGFNPGGLLKEDMLGSMYDELLETLTLRAGVVSIESREGDIVGNYQDLKNITNS